MKTSSNTFRLAMVGAFAFAAVTIAGAGRAHAANCMAAAYAAKNGIAPGDVDEGTLGCTANDFTVSSVNVTQVLNNDCGGPTNTFTFSGTLNIGDPKNDRYDVGFYIANNGSDAELGSSCSVFVAAPGVTTVNDGDSCGDFGPPSLSSQVTVTNVTASCADTDGDGFFDLALCTGYDQNSNTTCNGAADAVPGTSSKCDCTTVNTDVEIPECDTNADCTADSNVCTDTVCLGIGQPGADFFGCGNVNNTASCDDGLFCNGADTCSNGSCNSAGNPCLGGGVCGDNCNEAADNCFDPQGTVCRAAAGECDVQEVCTGTSAACPSNQFLASECRASTGECDPAENCTGSSATCPADEQATDGTACTADANECTDDICADGSCAHPNNTDPCDDGLDCTEGDACSSGSCSGSPVVCDDGVDCTDDECIEGGGGCQSTPDNGFCSDNDACTSDICSPVSGCINNLTCGPTICRSPGYWATHSGYEKVKQSSINVGQLVIDAVGSLQVCGETITKTSNAASPFVEGLGLTSDLEGLCMRARGVKQRQLYRQLTATALNCAITGGNCDEVIEPLVGVKFSECSSLCAGSPVVDGPTEGECVGALDCFNNGGQIIDGKCATGTCESDETVECGGDYDDCEVGVCIPFENNCHDAALCNESLGVCPKKTPASSPAACREARHNECTIDSCN